MSQADTRDIPLLPQNSFPSARAIVTNNFVDSNLLTRFKSSEDALAYAYSLSVSDTDSTWDPTIPTSNEQTRALVAVLIQAFKTLDYATDNDASRRKFEKEAHDNDMIEMRCWELIEKCLERSQGHVHLAKHGGHLPGSRRHQEHGTEMCFADRFDALVTTMARHKVKCKAIYDAPFLDRLIDDPALIDKNTSYVQRHNNKRRVRPKKEAQVELQELSLERNAKESPKKRATWSDTKELEDRHYENDYIVRDSTGIVTTSSSSSPKRQRALLPKSAEPVQKAAQNQAQPESPRPQIGNTHVQAHEIKPVLQSQLSPLHASPRLLFTPALEQSNYSSGSRSAFDPAKSVRIGQGCYTPPLHLSPDYSNLNSASGVGTYDASCNGQQQQLSAYPTPSRSFAASPSIPPLSFNTITGSSPMKPNDQDLTYSPTHGTRERLSAFDMHDSPIIFEPRRQAIEGLGIAAFSPQSGTSSNQMQPFDHNLGNENHIYHDTYAIKMPHLAPVLPSEFRQVVDNTQVPTSHLGHHAHTIQPLWTDQDQQQETQVDPFLLQDSLFNIDSEVTDQNQHGTSADTQDELCENCESYL